MIHKKSCGPLLELKTPPKIKTEGLKRARQNWPDRNRKFLQPDILAAFLINPVNVGRTGTENSSNRISGVQLSHIRGGNMLVRNRIIRLLEIRSVIYKINGHVKIGRTETGNSGYFGCIYNKSGEHWQDRNRKLQQPYIRCAII